MRKKKASRASSSCTHMHHHVNDFYVQESRKLGFRARSVFKLKEMDEKFSLFSRRRLVVDLGSAPGSWSQYAAQKKVQVVAVDCLAMAPIPGVTFLQGDFTKEAFVSDVNQVLEACGRSVDVVLSDLSPNLTGIHSVDWARCSSLAELALAFACRFLVTGGFFVVKVFQGRGFEEFGQEVHACFHKVHFFRPKASRLQSRELYICATGYYEHRKNRAIVVL